MLSRGYDGTMSPLEGRRASASGWWPLAFPLMAWTLASAALVTG